MFTGKKWPTECQEGTLLPICLIANQKFMIYRDEKKIWEFYL